MTSILESFHSKLGDFLSNNIIRPIVEAETTLTTIINNLNLLLGNQDEDLPQVRQSMLTMLMHLARTFYHTSVATHLKKVDVLADIFEKEYEMAYWRGVLERERLINYLKEQVQQVNRFESCFEEIKKDLNLLKQQLQILDSSLKFYSQLILIMIKKVSPNPPPPFILQEELQESFALLHAEQMIKDQYVELIELYHAVKKHDADNAEIDHVLRSLRLMYALSSKALDIIKDTYRETVLLFHDAASPLHETFRSEVEGTQKILDLIEVRLHQKPTIDLLEVAKTIDVISWGLEDFDLRDLLTESREKLSKITRTQLSGLDQILEKAQLLIIEGQIGT